jgi:hypothetical protein
MYNRASFLLRKIYIEALCKPGAYFASMELQQNRFFSTAAKHKKAFLFSEMKWRKKVEEAELGEKGNWNNINQ